MERLQAELDLIKSSKGKPKTKVQPVTETHRSSVAHDIKNSYIQNLHMKSSMFMLWLGTAVLSYAHKIPYIKHIITALSVMYGRTTIWKVLVKLRKIFILFNAAIGVYLTFKTVGFSYDNILAGFAGMGHSYLELFTNFTKRLFHWFVELFDHKVIPNVPGDKPLGGNKNIWLPKGIESNSFYPKPNVESSLRDSYKSLFNISVEPAPTSWYRDLSSWLWVGGAVLGGVVVVGTVYVVYKFIQDPSFVLFLGNSEGTATTDVSNAMNANLRTTITPASPEDVSEGSSVFAITKLLVRGVGNGLKNLNPAYWFLTSTDNSGQLKEFMSQQATTKKLESFYPYTNINPYDSWIKRMRISWLGETTAEITGRKSLAKEYLDIIVGPAAVVRENVASGSNITLHATPHVTTVGLTFDSGFMDVANKVASLPTTPGGRLSHTILPDLGNPFDGMESGIFGTPPLEELDEVVETTSLYD